MPFFAVVVLLPGSLFVEQSNREFKKNTESITALVPKAIATHVVISEIVNLM